MSVSDDKAAPPPAGHRRPRLWPAAILAGAIVLGLWGPNLVRPPPAAWTVYASVKGQTKRVRLADKSLLWMNGAASARVRFDDRARQIALDGGEAEVLVALNNRPFEISAGDRRIEARGGDFNLSRYPLQGQVVTTLTVRRGEARVGQVGARQGPDALRPGQQISWIDGLPANPVRGVDANAAFAWQRRQLVFTDEPLANVAASLNRYLDRPILISQPAVGQLRFTGVLALDREERILKRLEAAAPVQAEVRRDVVVLRGRARPAARACGARSCRPGATPTLNS